MWRGGSGLLAVVVGALALVAASGAGAHGGRQTEFGDWNGVISFDITSNYSSGTTVTTSHDARTYVVHGATAQMTGRGQLTTSFESPICGPASDSWVWGGTGSVEASVSIDNDHIYASFGPLTAPYSYQATGSGDGGPGVGVCGAPRVPPDSGPAGTGAGQFSWRRNENVRYLLRTSGSKTVSIGTGGGSPNPFALPGSLSYPATITVSWNFKRIGPDRDHDGLADAGDPQPNDPDTDGDGYPDGWEVDHRTNPNRRTSHPDRPWTKGPPDSDGDGWSDPVEIQKGTNPHKKGSHPNGNGDSQPIIPKPLPPRKGGGGGGGGAPGEWYGFKIISNRCSYVGAADKYGDRKTHAVVKLTMFVFNAANPTQLYANELRAKARLELPVGTNMGRPWVEWKSPQLGDAQKYVFAITLTTHPVDSSGTSAGGQAFRVHVRLTWARPSLRDVQKDLFLDHLINGTCK